MATETTAPAIAPEILEERWHYAEQRTVRIGKGHCVYSYGVDNSKAVDAIINAIESMGAKLVYEVREDDLSDLTDLACNLIQSAIKPALFEWAQSYEAERRARIEARKAAAA